MALTNAQLEQAVDMLVETIDEALKLVSDTLALHNRALLQLATNKDVTINDTTRLQSLADAWKQAQKEEQKP